MVDEPRRPDAVGLTVRHEEARDAGPIARLHESAFPTPAEAALVGALRAAGRLALSLVAIIEEGVVGHVAFSPVTIVSRMTTANPRPGAGLGLAPLAVASTHRRCGIGAALLEAGLAGCARDGIGYVVVLGEPHYYRRFGFVRASDRGLANEYGAVEEFMVLELRPGAVSPGGGLVRYAPEFAALGS